MIDVKRFDKNMSKYPLNPQNINQCLVNGVFEEDVNVGGQVVNTGGACREIVGGEKMSFITYITENLEYDNSCLVVAPPSDCDALDFLEHSGIKDFADRNKIFLHILKPFSGWQLDGKGAEYMNAVYIQIQARDFYVTMQDNIYALGIGDGATVATQAVMRSTSEWSGLDAVGNLDSRSVMPNSSVSAGSGGRINELVISGEKCPLPVWLATEAEDRAACMFTEYWKKQNNCRELCFSGEGADKIFAPSPISFSSRINSETIAQVRLTLGVKEFSIKLFEKMWKYIGAARRHRSFGLKDLRYYRNPADRGAVKREVIHNGITRIWYELVPEKAKGKLPVVVCLHGRGNSAQAFFDISGIYATAQERGFIAVVPQAGAYQQKPPLGIKNVLLWDFPGTDSSEYDNIGFIRRMIDDVKSRLDVDEDRIFCCGQSSGGMMSAKLAVCCPDVFTACAPWSGVFEPEMAEACSSNPAPVFIMRGEKDMMEDFSQPSPFPFQAGDSYIKFINYYIDRYSLNPSPLEYVNGIYHFYEFVNKENIPILTYVQVADMPHANVPEQSWISWDAFFAYWSGKDGNLKFKGKKTDKKE